LTVYLNAALGGVYPNPKRH